MIRYPVGTKILVKNMDRIDSDPIEVELLDRMPNYVKVRVLSEGWFAVGSIRWLPTGSYEKEQWFSVGKVFPTR